MSHDPRAAIDLSKHRVRLRFTREGYVYLVVLAFVTAGALFRNVNLLILLSGMMLVPLLLGWRLTFAMLRGLEVRRSFPNRLHAGQTWTITWRVTNLRTALSVWQIQIEDRLRHVASQQLTTARLIINEVAPRQHEFGSLKAFFGQRGQYLWDATVISTRFPLGLIEASCELPGSAQFVVAPPLGKLTTRWDQRLLSQASGSHSRARRRGLMDDEFFALRPWRGGDPRRYIHWRSSARHQQLMVREFDTRSDRDLVLLLDLYAARESRSADRLGVAPIEHVLSFAATVLTQAGHVVKGKIGLAVCGADSVLLADYASAHFVDGSLLELGVAEASDHPDLMNGLLNLAGEIAGGTPFYVVSTRPPQDLAGLVPRIHWHRFRAIEPWVRWLTVETPEFAQLFESPLHRLGDLAPLAEENRLSAAVPQGGQA